MASLKASVANGELDPEHENYSLEAFAAGRDGDRAVLHRERAKRHHLERCRVAAYDELQREERKHQLVVREHVKSALAATEQARLEYAASLWRAEFERGGVEGFEETLRGLQLDRAQRRAEAQRYYFDENPFDEANVVGVLLEGDDSACADFFKRIDAREEEEDREREEAKKGGAAAAAASFSSVVELEGHKGDFYRHLPDAEKYIMSKKEQQELN